MSGRKKQRVLLDSYKIGAHRLRPGQCVMLRPPTKGAAPYIARIEQIEQQQHVGASGKDTGGTVMLVCRWYYRPEESMGGRRLFHGSKEVFLSDHVDRCFPESVECECIVHTLRAYTALSVIRDQDFFCRFHYNASSGLLSPDKVAVYCTCEMPFNPDCKMLFCTTCQDLFHPECVGLPNSSNNSNKSNSLRTKTVTSSVERFTCPNCQDSKEAAKGKGVAGGAKVKVESEGATSRQNAKDVAAA